MVLDRRQRSVRNQQKNMGTRRVYTLPGPFALVTQKQGTRARALSTPLAVLSPGSARCCVYSAITVGRISRNSFLSSPLNQLPPKTRPAIFFLYTFSCPCCTSGPKKEEKKYLLLFSYLIRPFRPSGAFHSRRIRIKAERGLCCVLAYFIYLCCIRLFSFSKGGRLGRSPWPSAHYLFRPHEYLPKW